MVRLYWIQILEGLEFLHSKSIMHQDLKCANVLMWSDGKVRISDFGWARMIEKSMSCNDMYKSLKGTIPWMAPEIVAQRALSEKSDIWSFGWVILEMITGKAPWNEQQIGNNIEDLFKLWDRYSHPDIPEDSSENLKDFLNQWFKIDYRDRPSAHDLLNHTFLN